MIASAQETNRPYLKRWETSENHPYFNFPTDSVIFCIGTPLAAGDSLGPRIGSKLKALGVPNVYGTVKKPIHAENIQEYIDKVMSLHPNSTIIAIDASVADSEEERDRITLREESIVPGKGVDKVLPSIGDFCISGVTIVAKKDAGLWEKFTELRGASVGAVNKMRDNIVSFLMDSLSISDSILSSEVAVSDLAAIKKMLSDVKFKITIDKKYI